MFGRAVALASLLALIGLAGSAGAASAGCGIPSGQPVLLRSGDLDPDVFVWDSKQRVVAYAAGYWKNTTDVMSHTVLSKPGTRAVVIACDKEIVHSRYANAVQDAIGIRLMTGPSRGRYGWVSSEDVHFMPKTADAAAPAKPKN